MTRPLFLAGDLIEIVHARAWVYADGDIGMITAVGNPALSPAGEQKYAILIKGVKAIVYAYEIKWCGSCKMTQNVV